METIYKIKGTFHGLYELGKGWDYETSRMWNEFWKGTNPIFWKFFQNGQEQHLVSTYGSIFLHPMNFTAILSAGYMDMDSELAELKKLCTRCAEACGGTFEMEVTRKQVEF